MQYHSELCNTPTDDLLSECEAGDIISKDDKEETDAIPSTQKKIEKLLEKIIKSLEARYSIKFLVLLYIKLRDGIKSIIQLANKTQSSISQSSRDDDENKGKGIVKVHNAHTISGLLDTCDLYIHLMVIVILFFLQFPMCILF